MATISTHTGDGGETGLLGPNRVSKDDPIIEALGALDEAQSAIGLARAHTSDEAAKRLLDIQRVLYRLMGEVSTSGQPDGEATARQYDMWTTTEQVDLLESDIVAWRETVPGQFIIPGESPFDGAIHLARAVVRRAERRLVTMRRDGLLANSETLKYVNRLSDWLYVFAQQYGATPVVVSRTKTKRSSRAR